MRVQDFGLASWRGKVWSVIFILSLSLGLGLEGAWKVGDDGSIGG